MADFQGPVLQVLARFLEAAHLQLVPGYLEVVADFQGPVLQVLARFLEAAHLQVTGLGCFANFPPLLAPVLGNSVALHLDNKVCETNQRTIISIRERALNQRLCKDCNSLEYIKYLSWRFLRTL